MDGWVLHTSVAIYTGRERAYVDRHAHICNANTHADALEHY